MLIPSKTIKVFANNKPWVTKEIKSVLNKKKLAFRNKDKDNIKLVQKEVKREIEKGKCECKNKIEEKFDTNHMKSVWKGMNMMSGRTKSDNDNYADELNSCYTRFDCHDFSKEREDIMQELRRNATSEPQPHIVIVESSVFKLMNKVNPKQSQRSRQCTT